MPISASRKGQSNKDMCFQISRPADKMPARSSTSCTRLRDGFPMPGASVSKPGKRYKKRQARFADLESVKVRAEYFCHLAVGLGSFSNYLSQLIARQSFSNCSLKSGWAISTRARMRSFNVRPYNWAIPYSVTT